MKSIKPGRGPSIMGGISSIFTVLFGIVWTVIALKNGGGLFALFGVIFVAYAAALAVYQFKNATRKNRYSMFDITEDSEESDPLNEYFGSETDNDESGEPARDADSDFCPYCGTPVSGDYEFCNKCGKKLP